MDVEISVLSSHLNKIYELLSSLESMDGNENRYFAQPGGLNHISFVKFIFRDDLVAKLGVIAVHFSKLDQILKGNRCFSDVFLEPSGKIPDSVLGSQLSIFPLVYSSSERIYEN